MGDFPDTTFPATRLLWVGVIALVASAITAWFRTESVPLTLAFGAASAVISMAIVGLVYWTRRPR